MVDNIITNKNIKLIKGIVQTKKYHIHESVENLTKFDILGINGKVACTVHINLKDLEEVERKRIYAEMCEGLEIKPKYDPNSIVILDKSKIINEIIKDLANNE